jgi:hypothetical protein
MTVAGHDCALRDHFEAFASQLLGRHHAAHLGRHRANADRNPNHQEKQMITGKDKERWWERIASLEPRLASDEARSQIEAVLTAFVQARTFYKQRKIRRPWGFSYKDAAGMKKRMEELKKDIQPYLPSERTAAGLKVRQCVADLDLITEYLGGLEWWARQAERRGRKKEGLLQELVAQLGKIRQSFTGKPLKSGREFLYRCLDGLGEHQTAISNALTYVVDHPEEFRRVAMPDGVGGWHYYEK